MIEKVSDQWNRIEQSVGPAVNRQGDDGEALEQVVGQIRGVRDVLKRMCDVHVTRTSLRSAVREALLPVIREHRDELFPELVELRERLARADEDPHALDPYRPGGEAAGTAANLGDGGGAGIPEDFAQRLEGFEERIRRLAGLGAELQENLGRVTQDLEGVEAKIEKRVEATREEQQRSLEATEAKLAEEIRGQKLSVEEKVGKVQEYLKRLEAEMPETARSAASDVEQRLREEIQSMVEKLSGELGNVREMLQRIEEIVPRRETLESLDGRLARLEESFGQVSQSVGHLDGLAPELEGLGERFADLRRRVQETSETVGRSAGDVQVALGSRLDELKRVLEEGIRRWEADQTEMQDRLTGLRDSLRDQLATLGQQVAREKGSLWGKLSGKKEAGLKLSADDFEELSGKLETIIGGLEGIIARRKEEGGGPSTN